MTPVSVNPTYFGAGAVLPASFDDEQLMIGTSGADTIVDTSTGSMAIFADAGNDSITGGAWQQRDLWRHRHGHRRLFHHRDHGQHHRRRGCRSGVRR